MSEAQLWKLNSGAQPDKGFPGESLSLIWFHGKDANLSLIYQVAVGRLCNDGTKTPLVGIKSLGY